MLSVWARLSQVFRAAMVEVVPRESPDATYHRRPFLDTVPSNMHDNGISDRER